MKYTLSLLLFISFLPYITGQQEVMLKPIPKADDAATRPLVFAFNGDADKHYNYTNSYSKNGLVYDNLQTLR
jgi:hypothetical protein